MASVFGKRWSWKELLVKLDTIPEYNVTDTVANHTYSNGSIAGISTCQSVNTEHALITLIRKTEGGAEDTNERTV